MTSVYNDIPTANIFFDRFKELGANQITVRRMYTSGRGALEDVWIKNHLVLDKIMDKIELFYIKCISLFMLF